MSTTPRPRRSTRRHIAGRQPSDRALPTVLVADAVAFAASGRSSIVQALASHHGYRTERQRATLRASLQRHVNARYLHLDEANAGLAMLGLAPLYGPSVVR